MALTILDRRTVIDDAEVDTEWTGDGANFDVQSIDVAEDTNAIQDAYNPGDGGDYYTYPAGSIDLSDTLVYVYSFNNALQNVWDNAIPPQALLLGDGTDRIGFHMAGANKRVFNHLDGPTTWQCLVLDGSQASAMDTAGLTYAHSGSFVNLDLTQIVDVGCYFQTLSKAIGGGYNVSVDIMRYGNDGIYIVDGTPGDEGTFRELAAADRSTADQEAHGIFREFTPVSFGCQGPLTFGEPNGGHDAYFEDSGAVVVFEDRNISDDKYYFAVKGDSTAVNWFGLSNATITTAGPKVRVEFGEKLNNLSLSTVSFTDLGNEITFPYDAAHPIDACVFSGCGQVTIGSSEFRNCTFSETAADSTSSEAAVWWQFDHADFQSCTVSDNYYGIVMDSTSDETTTFTEITFSGNTYDVLWLGEGTLTINVVDGDAPTYLALNGGTVVIIAAIDWYFEIQNSAGTIVTNAEFRIYDSNDNELYGVETSDGTEKYTFNGTISGTDARIVCLSLDYLYFTQTLTHPSSSNSAAAPIVISLGTDRVYENL